MYSQMQSEIAEINGEIEELDDLRARYTLVQARIRHYRQTGLKVPEDLLMIERRLIRECMEMSQGR